MTRSLRRLAVALPLVVAATTLSAPGSPAATSSTSGQPIYQFAATGTGPLPWNATALSGVLHGTTMVGAPHAASSPAEGALAYRTASGHVALYVAPAGGVATWTDLSARGPAPTPGADPVPFFDPSGAVDVAYVDTVGDLIVLSSADPVSTFWTRAHRLGAWSAQAVVDVSAAVGVTFANGLPGVSSSAAGETLAARTAAGAVEVVTLAWPQGGLAPYVAAAANVTAAAGLGPATSDPVVTPTATPAVITTVGAGDLELIAATGAGASPWVAADVSKSVGGARVPGPFAIAAGTTSYYVAGLAASGAVDLFSQALSGLGGPAPAAPPFTAPTPVGPPATTTTLAPAIASGAPGSPWSVTNVTSLAPGAPPLAGSLFLSATGAVVTVAGQAANWGDLFAISGVAPSGPYAATDVSVTAGSAARTVAGAVAGFTTGAGLSLFAAGVASPPPQGVGVYAIPSAKWTQAVSDGWPILSETGGLGTTKTPWVGYVGASAVNASPDFLMGQSIYNAHKRVTWLSFWTVSGPQKGEAKAAATYYSHGFAAGAWVATQIDQYRGLGVGLKPDWVIFDPEGYPDNHSGLDAPGGSSAATMATYATYWSSMLSGWQRGLDSVDPSLNAAVYANQSEYRNYQLATSPLPVFEAVAFSGGGPVPVAGASGSNVRGFIAFAAVCTPPATLASEEQTLLNPPWAGQFNTLQFNAGVYCAPSASAPTTTTTVAPTTTTSAPG